MNALNEQPGLQLPLDQRSLDFGDRLGWIEALRAGLRAVHDGVAAVELERIIERIEPLAGLLIARIDDPASCLQQRRRAHVFLWVPPVARARGRAAGAQDALVEPVELLAVLLRLFPFLLGRRRLGPQVWLRGGM